MAFLTLTLAVAAAFVPVVMVLWVAVGLMLAVGTVLAGSSFRVALWFVVSTAMSAALALLLNLPWALEWSWDRIVGAAGSPATGRGLLDIATLAPTPDRFAVLAIALYLPLLAAVAISRAWRLTWSVRAGVLVAGFGAVAVLGERGSIETELPSTAMLSVPIALGLALSAAAIAGGFGSDVLQRGFGWRQPIALLANVAIFVGLVPATLAIGHGGWHTPSTTMVSLLEAQLPADPAAGDYRVLYLGDPRVIPVVNDEYVDGIAFGVADAGDFDFTDRFVVPDTAADEAVERALGLIADGSTLRAGRILAPLGIRYVVVPKTDGVTSTVDDPIPLPVGLVASLQNQLDLGSVYGPPTLEIFVNQSWIPVGSQLTGATAAASRLAGEDALARADLGEAVPSMVGANTGAPSGVNQVVPGALHVAVPFDERISLTVDGVALAPRPSFGVSTAFDIETAGDAVLTYDDDTSRGWWRVLQVVLWLAVLVVAAGARSPFGRRRSGELHDETLIDLTDEPLVATSVAGEVLGTPEWADEWPPDEHLDERTGDPVRRSAPAPTPTVAVDPTATRLDRDAVFDEPEEPDDDEIDLASLVASVDEADDHRTDGTQ